MTPENDLKNNPCTVRVFINDIEFVSKFFDDRQKRIEWMLKVTNNLAGVKNLYFQLSYQYPVLKEHKDYGNDFWARPIKKEKIMVLKDVPENMDEYTKKVFVRHKGVYSNKSAMGIASSGM